jgi:hypothetical protein
MKDIEVVSKWVRAKDIPSMVRLVQELDRQKGGCTPEALVKRAENPNCVAHSYFPWDDAEAARLHRLTIARWLLRALQLKLEVKEGRTSGIRHIRLLHHVHDEKGDAGRYALLDDVAQNSELQAQVLDEAYMLLMQLQQKCENLQELLPNLGPTVTALLTQVSGVRRTLHDQRGASGRGRSNKQSAA